MDGTEAGGFPNSVFTLQMLNHKRSECLRLQSRSNNCAGVGLGRQRITDNQFVIPLYVNGKLDKETRGLIYH